MTISKEWLCVILTIITHKISFTGTHEIKPLSIKSYGDTLLSFTVVIWLIQSPGLKHQTLLVIRPAPAVDVVEESDPGVWRELFLICSFLQTCPVFITLNGGQVSMVRPAVILCIFPRHILFDQNILLFYTQELMTAVLQENTVVSISFLFFPVSSLNVSIWLAFICLIVCVSFVLFLNKVSQSLILRQDAMGRNVLGYVCNPSSSKERDASGNAFSVTALVQRMVRRHGRVM